MAIKGSLKEASLPDVLQLLSMGEKTGVLNVTDRNNFGNIYLQKGKVVYSTLVNRMDRIGDLLLRDKKITEVQLRDAVKHQQSGQQNKRLGEILVEMNAITAGEMERYLRIQIEDTIYTMLNWDDGFFHFEPDQSLDSKLNVALPTNDLLLEGARKVDEWKSIKDIIPSPKAILAYKNKEKLQHIDVPPTFQPLMNSIDGEKSIEEMCDQHDVDALAASKYFKELVLNDVLTLRGEQKEGKKPGFHISKKAESMNLGLAFYKTGMYSEAKREYEKVLEIDSKNLKALFYMAMLMFHIGQYDDSIEYYEKALELSPSNPKIYNNLGVVLEQEGAISSAFMHYRKAIQIDETYVNAYHNLGNLYYQKADYEKATTYFKKAIELDDKMMISYFYLGLSLILQKKIDHALKIYQKALEKEPENALIHNNLGAIYQFKRQRDECISHYEEAIRINTNLTMPHRNLGNIYYQGGLHDKAEIEFKRVVEIDDTLADVFFKLGNIYLKNGKKEEAIKFWSKAAKLEPENEVIKRNLQLIKNASML